MSFNRNHIIFSKSFFQKKAEKNECTYSEEYAYNEMYTNYHNKYVPRKKIIEEKESPLGFVYRKTTVVEEHYEKVSNRPMNGFVPASKIVYHVFTANAGNNSYFIKFPFSCNDTYVSIDTRPWEILDGSMDDNIVNILLKETESMISDLKSINPKFTYKYSKYNSFSEWKDMLYKELYGNEKGPRYQTNEEKILAHCFDLKTSFRKDKEK